MDLYIILGMDDLFDCFGESTIFITIDPNCWYRDTEFEDDNKDTNRLYVSSRSMSILTEDLCIQWHTVHILRSHRCDLSSGCIKNRFCLPRRPLDILQDAREAQGIRKENARFAAESMDEPKTEDMPALYRHDRLLWRCSTTA